MLHIHSVRLDVVDEKDRRMSTSNPITRLIINCYESGDTIDRTLGGSAAPPRHSQAELNDEDEPSSQNLELVLQHDPE